VCSVLHHTPPSLSCQQCVRESACCSVLQRVAECRRELRCVCVSQRKRETLSAERETLSPEREPIQIQAECARGCRSELQCVCMLQCKMETIDIIATAVGRGGLESGSKVLKLGAVVDGKERDPHLIICQSVSYQSCSLRPVYVAYRCISAYICISTTLRRIPMYIHINTHVYPHKVRGLGSSRWREN